MTPAIDPSSTPPPTTDDVFALLEWVLSSARLRLRAEAKPIGFSLIILAHETRAMLPSHEAWLFDPKHDGALFRRVSNLPEGILTLTCEPDSLKRLVAEDEFTLRDEDTASFDGRIEDLLVLADVLDEQKSALGIRAASKSGSKR